MKHIFIVFTFLLIFFSCQKEIRVSKPTDPFFETVKSSLKDSVSASDFNALDFTTVHKTFIDSGAVTFVWVPFRGEKEMEDFVLLETTADGNIKRGKIIHLQGAITENKFNGSVLISTLGRKETINSAISDGYIQAFLHTSRTSMPNFKSDPVFPDPYTPLPEVVVIAFIHSGSDGSQSTYVSLPGFFYGFSFGAGPGYYNLWPITNGNAAGNSNPGWNNNPAGMGAPISGGGSVQVSSPIEVEAEYIYDLPGIDINKFFKCFDNVPSNGATLTIKLSCDLPSNKNPNASVKFRGLSPGHTFLTITKSNGSANVTQSFGFYPSHQPSALDPFSPVPSSIKDNGFREINASIEMNITEQEFNIIKQNAIAWSSHTYEVADYNCTDYAVDIFNSVRSNPIMLSPYNIVMPSYNPYNPGSGSPVTITVNKSPQMLFSKLKEMKTQFVPEAGNILLDLSHDYRAPISNGECN